MTRVSSDANGSDNLDANVVHVHFPLGGVERKQRKTQHPKTPLKRLTAAEKKTLRFPMPNTKRTQLRAFDRLLLGVAEMRQELIDQPGAFTIEELSARWDTVQTRVRAPITTPHELLAPGIPLTEAHVTGFVDTAAVKKVGPAA